MKQRSILMRVLFCKIQCPSFFSLCKPSSHLYNPGGPLKSENSSHVPTSTSSVASLSDDDDGSEKLSRIKEAISDGNQQAENALKSCIRTASKLPQPVALKDKKKVQWVDNIGKELVEIKEFESSDTGETDSELENRTCACLIL